jgi:pimeloyl-ACP methyl ester carboxylesterase
MVMWAPVVRARTYVREREALGKIAGAKRPEGADYLEAGGFILSDETAADLKAIDLTRLDYQLSGNVLVVERDDLGDTTGFPARLNGRGINVSVTTGAGYVEMMDEPHFTVVPHATLEEISEWLAARVPEEQEIAESAASARTPVVRKADDQEGFGSEELLQIPGQTPLFGVLTRPRGERDRERPLVILSNSGSVHQVGPNRVYVDLARDLAISGYPSLRFDLRNLGDSILGRPPAENHPYPDTALQDVDAVIDWARHEKGYDRFIMSGICSGAYTAFRAGCELIDQRLIGVIPVNPLTFHWHQGLSLAIPPPTYQTIRDAKYYEGAARDPKKWLRLLRGESNLTRLASFFVRRARDVVGDAARDLLETLRLRELSRLSKDLARYDDAGRRIDFVFSRSDPGHGILVAEARGMVRRLARHNRLSLSFIEGADHTFSRKEWRAQLARAVIARLEEYEIDR